MSPYARRTAAWTRGLRGRAFAAMALLALATPTLLLAGGGGAAGWIAGHGHVYLSPEAAARGHQHPWEHDFTRAASPAAIDATAPAPDGVVFTTSDLDGATALTMLAVPAAVLLLAVVWRSAPVLPAEPILAGVRSRPLLPPPQQ